MVLCATKVEINFKANRAAANNWIDVTSYVVSAINIKRGRQSELERYPAGTASFTLLNTDRRFDFSNAAGPYYGIMPVRSECRITATYSAVTYPLFFGYVQGWPQSYDEASKMATVDVQVVDLFDILAQKRWFGGPGDQELRVLKPDSWFRMVGEQSPEVALDWQGKSLIFSSDAVANDNEGNAIQSDAQGSIARFNGHGFAKSSTALMTPGTAWTVGFWMRCRPKSMHFDNAKASLVLQVGYSIYFDVDMNQTGEQVEANLVIYLVDNGGGNFIEMMPGIRVDDDKWHHIMLRSQPGFSVMFYLDGVNIIGNIGWNGDAAHTCDDFSHLAIGFSVGGTRQPFVGWLHDFWCFDSDIGIQACFDIYDAAIGWPGQLSSERITSMLDVFELGAYPATISAGYSLVSNTKNYAGAALLDTLQDVAEAEGGMIYIDSDGTFIFRNRFDSYTQTRSANVQATFDDAAGNTRYMEAGTVTDMQFLFNQATFSRENGPSFTVRDDTSIATYEVRSFSRTGLPLAIDNDLINAAQTMVLRYGTLKPRLPYVRFSGRTNNDAMLKALGLKIQDLIEVRRKPQNVGSQWIYQSHIEGIEYNIDLANLTFDVTLNLTQFGILSGLLQIGNSTYKLDNGKLG